MTVARGIECRSSGASGDYQLVLTFPETVTAAGATVSAGTGSVSGFTVNGSEVQINLTGVANAQTTAVALSGVSNGTATSDVVIPISILLGDTTGNGTVNASDVGQVKSKSGQSVDATNFRQDVNTNGSINASDIGLVKSQSGAALP